MGIFVVTPKKSFEFGLILLRVFMKRKWTSHSIVVSTLLFGGLWVFASVTPSQDNKVEPDTYVVWDTSWIHLKSDKANSGISFLPSQNNITTQTYFEKDNYRLEIELKSAINGINDNRVKASLALLHTGAKQGTYISVEKWSELEKLALAHSIAIEGWRIKLSYAFLRKVVEASFPEVSKTYEPEMKQNSYALDYTKPFAKWNIIRELTTTVVYYDVWDKYLWKLGDIIRDTATEYEWHEVYGWVRGGSKIVVDTSLAFELSKTFRADLTIGYENIKYNKFGDYDSKTQSGLTTWVWVTYKPDDYNKINIAYNYTRSWDEYTTTYSHQFSNGIEWFVEWDYKKWANWIENNRRVFVWVKMLIGGEYKRNKYTKFFNDSMKSSILNLQKLTVNSKVATDYIQVHEKLSWKDRIVYIDKTTLGAWDSLVKNADGTLASLLLDNGGFAVSAITWISDNSYSPYIKVISGQLAIVDFVWLNKKMAQDGLTTWQSKTLNVVVSDTSGGGTSIYAITLIKGSVEITSTVARAFDVTPAQATAFLAGTKTVAQINSENIADTTAPATPTLTINSWSEYTNSTTVDVSITWDTDNIWVTGWFISENSSTPAAWSFTAEPTVATISSWDWLKTLYAWTIDDAWNISNAGSDTITLDTAGATLSSDNINVWNNTTWTWTVSFNENVTLSSLKIVDAWDNSVDLWWSVSVNSWSWTSNITLNITTPNLSWQFVQIKWSTTDEAWNTSDFVSSFWQLN